MSQTSKEDAEKKDAEKNSKKETLDQVSAEAEAPGAGEKSLPLLQRSLFPFMAGVLGGGVFFCGLVAAVSLGLIRVRDTQRPPQASQKVQEQADHIASALQDMHAQMQQKTDMFFKELRAYEKRIDRIDAVILPDLVTQLNDLTQKMIDLQTFTQKADATRVQQEGLQEEITAQKDALATSRSAAQEKIAALEAQLQAFFQEEQNRRFILQTLLIKKIQNDLDHNKLSAVDFKSLDLLGDASSQGVISQLQALYRQGIPSVSLLQEGFPYEIVLSSLSAEPAALTHVSSSKFMSAMAEKFSDLVTITTPNTPKGEPEGTSQSLGALKQAVEEADFARALLLYQALPAEARRISESWGQKLQIRVLFEKSLQALEKHLSVEEAPEKKTLSMVE